MSELKHIAVIRMKSSVTAPRDVKAVFQMLKLNRIHTLVVFPQTPSVIGAVKKIESYVAWGELPEVRAKQLAAETPKGLHPPVKGFKSKKLSYPKGVLGHHSEHIGELIDSMSTRGSA